VTYPDLAEALQARIRANLEAGKIAHTPPDGDERLRIDILELHIAAPEEAVAEVEVLGEEVEQAAKKIAELERQISTLQEAIAKAEAIGEQQHQKAQTSAKRADHFLAEIIDMTGEFTEMSKQIREQTTEMDRLRAELDNYRLGS
jgi:predicted nucleic acid-binding protein